MDKKMVMVLLTHIDNLPPARNLIISLLKYNVRIDLITMYSYAIPNEISKNTHVQIYDVQKEIATSKLEALTNRFKRRHKVRNLVAKLMGNQDILWTVTDYDAMEVGKIAYNYNHVMQLMELIHDIPYFDELPFFKAHLYKMGQKAKIVVVPENNRAHIQQAYWNLQQTPFVIPNKPNVIKKGNYNIEEISLEAANVLKKIGNRKIVLYQGTFGYERVLDQFIEGVHLLGEDYCVLLMGNDCNDLQELLKKYPYVFYVPFISAPNHLAITSKAYIGILSYVNTNSIRHYDPLNALYCAPNKIFEYACYGLPMLGNNIPGLDIPFTQYKMGVCCSNLTAKEVAKSIKKIEENYVEMKKGCFEFYQSIDLDKSVKNVLDELEMEIDI